MRILLGILFCAFLASGCGTCKTCPTPIEEGTIVTQAKQFVADTATVVGYVVKQPSCASACAPAHAATTASAVTPARAGKTIIDTQKASMVRIRETPKTFTESSIFQKEGAK